MSRMFVKIAQANLRRFFLLMFSSIFLMGLQACADTKLIDSILPPSTPPQLHVMVSSANNINPNLRGVPSPVEVRLYQLSESQAFTDSNFLQLYEQPQEILKASLVVSRHLGSLLPNETKKYSMPLSTSVKYIGVVAGFADYLQAKNKSLIEMIAVSEPRDVYLNIHLDGLNMTVTIGDEDGWIE